MANHEMEVEAPVEEAFVPPIDVPQVPYETNIEPTYVGDIPQNVPEEMAPPAEPYLESAEEIPAGSEFQTSQDFQQSQDYPQSYQDSEQALVPAEPETMMTPEPEIDPYDFKQALGQPPPQPMQPMTSDSSDFSDVADFGNTNTSVGPLSYVVVIDGIESSHLLKQLKEAMTDSRFGWDVAALIAGMAGGRLILTGLSPAKASVLINRIKYLPFKISWRQDVLSSS